MKILKIIVVVLFCGTLLLLANNQKKGVFDIQLGDERIKVWIVESEKERSRGLSGIEEMSVDGMLFVFQEETIPLFWMKEMNFPIDIIWINSQREVVEITDNIYPETYPEIFSPLAAVQYVIEVDAGWCKEHKIKKGDKLIL